LNSTQQSDAKGEMKRRCEAMLCYAMTLGVDESFVIEIFYRELGFDLKRSEAMRRAK